jgi:uncharacterized protein YggU (UPF0235/DUF167 family)
VTGTKLRVRVVPGSSTPGVVGRYGDAWKIRVREAPERGRANDAVVELLAGTLSVPKSDVRLVSGHGTRDKLVELTSLSADETDRRLAAAELKGAA